MRVRKGRIVLYVSIALGAAVAAYGLNGWFSHKKALGQQFESRGLDRTYEGFYAAVKQGDVASVKLFLADGFSPNAKYDRAEVPILSISAKENRLDILNALIQAGADVNAAEPGGHRAIHVAARGAHADIVRALLKAGADPNALGQPNDEGGAFVPLYSACIRSSDSDDRTRERVETVQLLLDYGAKVNVYHPRNGDGPIHLAAFYGFDEVVQLLVKRGAEIEGENKFGDTPLMTAAVAGQSRAVTALLAAGAQVNHRTQRGTALLRAAEKGHAQVVRILLESGADPKLTNAAGKTAHDLAATQEVARVLRAASAS